jgi:DNA-binding GntR family transcriptional regulator
MKRIGRPKGTGTQRVYDELCGDILTLKLAPGAELSETALEARFGISRTPVREALIRLSSEGLISLLPNRGARVTSIDVSDIPQLFEALELCQRAAMRWAALRRTPEDLAEMRRLNQAFLDAARSGDTERMGDSNREFHLAVARACGNRYLGAQYASLLAVSLRMARTVFAQEHYEEAAQQHEAMIDLIEKRDVEGGDAMARRHTQLFRERVVRHFKASLASEVPLGSSA